MIERVMDLQEMSGTKVDSGFDYRQIEEQYRDEVKAATKSIKELGRAMQSSRLAIGKHLIEVKGMLPYGQFCGWIEAEFQLSERTAQNIMNAARLYGDGRSEIIAVLSDTVLYMLAAPSTPEEARVEVEQAAANGQKVTVEYTKETIAAAQVQKAAVQFAKPKPFESRQEIKSLRDPLPGSATYYSPEPRPQRVLTSEATPEQEPAQAAMPLEQARPEGPREATETPAQELLATPDDLAARGYTIVPSQDGEQWRWKREDGFGGAVYGPPVSLEDAIAHARKLIAIIEEFPSAMIKAGLEVIERNKAATAPAPAAMPDDLTAAGYILADTTPGPGWRWKRRIGREIISGPFVDAKAIVMRTPQEAIADARQHLDLHGNKVPRPKPSKVAQGPVWEYSGGATVRVAGGGSMGVSMNGPFPMGAPESGEYDVRVVFVKRIGKAVSA